VHESYPYLPQLKAETVQLYLAELEADSARGLDRGRAAALLRRVSSSGLRDWVKLNAPLALTPIVKRQVKELLARREEIRLNLGSGPDKIPGWLSVDILGMGADLTWDLRRGVPFPDGSVHAVFLEHVVEHFALRDVIVLLEECRRVLAPGGIIRVGVPDFGRYLESYAGDGRFIEELRPRRPTPLLAVAEVALHHGHRSVWDGPTLERIVSDAGFVGAATRRFGDSSLEPAPDTPNREPETVYVEARK
jgi:SAM-dependent methyltransferase